MRTFSIFVLINYNYINYDYEKTHNLCTHKYGRNSSIGL